MSDCCTGSCGCGKVINAPVVTPVIGSKRVEPGKYKGSAAKVFFSPIIDAEHLIKLYNLVNSEIYGKVAIKLHTGEKHGPNILPRDLVQALQATIPNSNIVETNTLYEGDRYTTESHRERPSRLTAGRSARSTSWTRTALSTCPLTAAST